MTAYLDPYMANVKAHLYDVLKRLIRDQPTLPFSDDGSEGIAGTLRWFDMAFKEIRGIGVTLQWKVDQSDLNDDNDDGEEAAFGVAGLSIVIGVSDQVDVHFMVRLEDMIDVGDVRQAIESLAATFEAQDGDVVKSLKDMFKKDDWQNVFFGFGAVAFGFSKNEEDEYRVELTTTDPINIETGRPSRFFLLD